MTTQTVEPRVARTTIEDDTDRCYRTHESRGTIYFAGPDDETPLMWDTGAGKGAGGPTDAGGAYWNRDGTILTYPPHRVHEVRQESYAVDHPHVLETRSWRPTGYYCRSYDCRFHSTSFFDTEDEGELLTLRADYITRTTEPNPRIVQPADAGSQALGSTDEHDQECVGCGAKVGTLHENWCAL